MCARLRARTGLADAHLRALDYMQENVGAHAFNLGNGNGFSVLQVISAAERVTRRTVTYEVAPRRGGGAAILVASSRRARDRLGWKPHFTEIENIILTAWDWHLNPAY